MVIGTCHQPAAFDQIATIAKLSTYKTVEGQILVSAVRSKPLNYFKLSFYSLRSDF